MSQPWDIVLYSNTALSFFTRLVDLSAGFLDLLDAFCSPMLSGKCLKPLQNLQVSYEDSGLLCIIGLNRNGQHTFHIFIYKICEPCILFPPLHNYALFSLGLFRNSS